MHEMSLNWEKADGLIPAVVQDRDTGRVLMLAFMNPEALEVTRNTGRATFWSRSRRQLWTKGETSGNYLMVEEIRIDCDGDTLLLLARPAGPTCHTNRASCFGEDHHLSALEMLGHLEKLIDSRKATLPAGSYTTSLFEKGSTEISKKLGEETVELVLAPAQGRQRTIEEAADVVYHLLVFLAGQDIPLKQVMDELARRHFVH